MYYVLRITVQYTFLLVFAEHVVVLEIREKQFNLFYKIMTKNTIRYIKSHVPNFILQPLPCYLCLMCEINIFCMTKICTVE
jgi:hypothetical protein